MISSLLRFLPCLILWTLPAVLGLSLGLSMNLSSTSWNYRGHDIYSLKRTPKSEKKSLFPFVSFEKTNKKPVVVLIHGFGCSSTYWRATIDALIGDGYEVHAIDLLGQGKSAKPGRSQGVEYSISLWADLVDYYIRENIPDNQNVVLVGNSLGSLIALSAITGDFVQDMCVNEARHDSLALKRGLIDRTKGLCMFNCGVGLNSRGIANEPQWSPLQKALINALYDVLTFAIFNNQSLLRYALSKLVTQELLRDTLQALYKCNPERVDSELVDSFYFPSQDEGAVEALSQIYCNDPGRTPVDIHNTYDDILKNIPIHLVWGDDDAVTPLQGGIGQFYSTLAKNPNTNVSFQVVNGGHVPFDDNPIISNRELLHWLKGK